jgi:hypothetical protein
MIGKAVNPIVAKPFAPFPPFPSATLNVVSPATVSVAARSRQAFQVISTSLFVVPRG